MAVLIVIILVFGLGLLLELDWAIDTARVVLALGGGGMALVGEKLG